MGNSDPLFLFKIAPCSKFDTPCSDDITGLIMHWYLFFKLFNNLLTCIFPCQGTLKSWTFHFYWNYLALRDIGTSTIIFSVQLCLYKGIGSSVQPSLSTILVSYQVSVSYILVFSNIRNCLTFHKLKVKIGRLPFMPLTRILQNPAVRLQLNIF